MQSVNGTKYTYFDVRKMEADRDDNKGGMDVM